VESSKQSVGNYTTKIDAFADMLHIWVPLVAIQNYKTTKMECENLQKTAFPWQQLAFVLRGFVRGSITSRTTTPTRYNTGTTTRVTVIFMVLLHGAGYG
jgi:hypothetical protein